MACKLNTAVQIPQASYKARKLNVTRQVAYTGEERYEPYGKGMIANFFRQFYSGVAEKRWLKLFEIQE